MTKLPISIIILNKLYTSAIKHPSTNRISINPATKLDRNYNQNSNINQIKKDKIINDAIVQLESQQLISGEHIKFTNGTNSDNYKAIVLNKTKLDTIKTLLIKHHITPLDDQLLQCQKQLNTLSDLNNPIAIELKNQLQTKIDNYTVPKSFNISISIIIALNALPDPTANYVMYSRELSQYAFHDTKSLEINSKQKHTNHRNKLVSILNEHHDSLDNHHIIETDKTQAIMELYAPDKCLIEDQKPTNHITISTVGYNLTKLQTSATQIISIENQTAFQRLCRATNLPPKTLLTYTGGHMSNEFKILYAQLVSQHPNIKLYHFGDIDLSGFTIADTLDKYMFENTNHHVHTWSMTTEVIDKFHQFGQSLTKNNIKTLTKKIDDLSNDNPRKHIYQKLIDYNCFIEQELIAYYITTLPSVTL